MQIHKIAIVDDEPQARETLAEVLELNGFETFMVEGDPSCEFLHTFDFKV